MTQTAPTSNVELVNTVSMTTHNENNPTRTVEYPPVHSDTVLPNCR